MNVRNTFLGAVALLGAAIAPAHAASISLNPNGVIPVNTGDTLNFTYSLNTTGLTSNLTSVTFQGFRDPTNLLLNGITQSPESLAAFGPIQYSTTPTSDPHVLDFTASFPNASSLAGVVPNSTIPLYTSHYTAQGPFSKGDVDLTVTGVQSAFAGTTNVTNQFTVSGSVDVQQAPEPNSNPLVLLGLGGLVAITAKKRIKKLKANF